MINTKIINGDLEEKRLVKLRVASKRIEITCLTCMDIYLYKTNKINLTTDQCQVAGLFNDTSSIWCNVLGLP